MRNTVWRIFNLFALSFIAINLYFINIKVFDNIYNKKAAAFTAVMSPTPAPVQTNTSDLMCPNNCLTVIKNATASVQVKNVYPTAAAGIIQPTLAPVQVREFFVPLGSGTTSNGNWAEVPGAQAYIDSSRYTSIKSVTFEAAVNVPGHNQGIWVRLFNSTDNYIIGGSELYYPDGNASALLSSGTINLGTGNKLYKVQMKTQLSFPAELTTARIHILTN